MGRKYAFLILTHIFPKSRSFFRSFWKRNIRFVMLLEETKVTGKGFLWLIGIFDESGVCLGSYEILCKETMFGIFFLDLRRG
jgi:hypothetical protein